MEEEFSKLSIEDREASEQNRKARYNKLVLDAKERARQGQLEEALDLFKSAYKIHKSDKLEKRIAKLKEFIKEYTEEPEEGNEEEEEESDDGLVDVGNGYRIAREIKEALYPYQLQALMWFWKLFKKHQGGILGDDMGLGKTIQVIAFLSGMFDCEHIRSALIVMPVAVIENWEKEFNKWTPGIRVKCFHGNSKKERLKDLHKVQLKNGVCLTTYGMVVSNHETLSEDINGRPFKWDYIILDEGHKIKNPTKTSKGIRSIPARNHFILTGTPIQNNLKEMWSLFDFVCQGQLLGSAKTFKTEFETPIVRARERDASAYEMKIGNEMAKSLRKLIEPHFLRRTKAEVLKKKDCETDTSEQDNTTSETPLKARVPKMLTRKNDFIVWLHLSKSQLKIYTDFVKLDEIKELLMSNRSPLAELNVLKKICDHPRLLSSMACSKLGLDENARIIDIDDADKENKNDSNQGVAGVSDAVLIQESGKMVFLVALLDNLKAEGHRCLVFSQSRKMLDMIQRVITHRGHKVLRIDGTIKSTAEREHLITTFQNNASYNCFLLTTQVGGVGLTLTGADRVVIFDPSWNPATDAQAVDRAYRIGQTRSVVIYRLITCGSIEEKIYRKQVFKCALSQQTTGSSKNPFRYFTSQDLRELFTLDDPAKSKTQLQLNKMHAKHRKSDELLDKHISFLHKLGIFGISDHDLIYSQEATETLEELEQSSANHEAIQARVLRAQHMVTAESSGGGQPMQSILPAPYQNPKSLLKPIDINNITDEATKSKIQTHLHNFEVFKPKKEDTKRFKPNIKKSIPSAATEVIDLSTPPASPPKNDNNRVKKQEDITVVPDDIETSMANLSLAGNERFSSDSRHQNLDSDRHDESENGSSRRPDSPNEQNSSEKLFDNDNSRETSLNIIDVETAETQDSEVSIINEENSTSPPETIDLDTSAGVSVSQDIEETNLNGTEDMGKQDINNYNSPADMESSVRLSSTINPEIEHSSTRGDEIPKYSPDTEDVSQDVFVQEDNSLQNSTSGFPNFQVNMFPAENGEEDKTESSERPKPQEGCPDKIPIKPNDIINNILVASPVVRLSDKPQTPIRRKSSSKNRRKSVSQRLFEKSDSEDSDDEVVKRSKTPRRFRKIESDEESDDEERLSSEAQKVKNLESNEISDLSLPMEQQNQTDDGNDEDDNAGEQKTNISDDEDEISISTNEVMRDREMISRREDKETILDSEAEDDTSTGTSSHSEATNGASEDEETGSPSGEFDNDDRATVQRKKKKSLLDSEDEDEESTESPSHSKATDGTSEDEETGSPSGAFNRGTANRKHKESMPYSEDEVEDDEESTGSSSHSKVTDEESDGEDRIHIRKSRVRGLDSTDESSDRDSFESESQGHSPQKTFSCPNGLHKSSAVKIQRCECVLSEKEKDTYRDLVDSARYQDDKYLALDNYLDALKICSSDLRVHKEALMLVRELGLGWEYHN